MDPLNIDFPRSLSIEVLYHSPGRMTSLLSLTSESLKWTYEYGLAPFQVPFCKFWRIILATVP